MNDFDIKIKKALQLKVQQIDDISFTKEIIEIHLNKEKNKPTPFLNFLSIIIGLSFLVFSVGIVFLIQQDYEWIAKLGLTLHHGIIFFIISLIFVIHKFFDEIFISNPIYNLLKK
jgi:hypothetical protein